MTPLELLPDKKQSLPIIKMKREYYNGFNSGTGQPDQVSSMIVVSRKDSIVSSEKDFDKFEKDHSLLKFKPIIETKNTMHRKPRPIEAFFHKTKPNETFQHEKHNVVLNSSPNQMNVRKSSRDSSTERKPNGDLVVFFKGREFELLSAAERNPRNRPYRDDDYSPH